MKVALVYIGLLAGLSGCSAYQVKQVTQNGNRIFPDGKYTHQITLHLPAGKTYRFKGLVSVTPDTIKVVGLSFFNTTAFRLSEDLKTGKITSEIFYEPMKKYEPRLRQFYSLLHTLVLLPVNPPHSENLKYSAVNSAGYPMTVEVSGLEKPVTLSFKNYDAKNIPHQILMDGGPFSVEVEVSAYEI